MKHEKITSELKSLTKTGNIRKKVILLNSTLILSCVISPFSDICRFLMYNIAVNRPINCGFVHSSRVIDVDLVLSKYTVNTKVTNEIAVPM